MHNQEHIIRKYRHIAKLPDWLFAFTFPMRRVAVASLSLSPGARVLDMGCGSGASFQFLLDIIGPSGELIGVDLSPHMLAAARARVAKHGWGNIRLLESPAETLTLYGKVDGILLFAMHDVLTSPPALDNMLPLLGGGGRVVAVGPKLAQHLPGRIFNPLVRVVYTRFAVSTADRDQPWRLLAQRLSQVQVKEYALGIIYLAVAH